MTDLGSVLGLGIAFVGGVVSFASPCCLPLVPAYIAYMVGATGEGTTGRRPALLHGLAFVAGFSLVFVAFYAMIGALGAVIDRRVLNMLGGALLIFLGLQVAGVINVRALWRDTRVMPTMGGGLVMAGGGSAAAPGPAGLRDRHLRQRHRRPGLPALLPVRPAVRGRLEPVHRAHPRRHPRPGHRDVERRPGHGAAGRLRGRPGDPVPRGGPGRVLGRHAG